MRRKLVTILCVTAMTAAIGLNSGCDGRIIAGGPGEEYFLDFDVAPDPYYGPFIYDYFFFRNYDDDDLEDFFDDLEDLFDD